MSWVWLSSGFVLPLGIRLHSKTPLMANFAPSSVSSRKKLLDCYIYGGLSYNRQENH